MDNNIDKDARLRSTAPFKLKDRVDRNWKGFDLRSQFGFLPETIIISKPHGMNNVIILSAILPKEKLIKHSKRNKNKSED